MPSGTDRGRWRNPGIWCLVVFLAGLFVRVALILPRYEHELYKPEAVNIAISLATTGRYADAYGKGVGPTAHYPPLHPLILSVLFRTFGTGAMGSLVMSLYGCVAASLAFALLPAIASASGMGLRAGIWGGMAGALLPFNFWTQTNGSIDAPLTAVFFGLLLWLFCLLWSSEKFTWREGTVLGLCAGAGCLANPTLLPVLAACTLATLLRFRSRLRQVATCLGAAALFLVLVLTPWAIRNQRVLGSWIWTRSNLGLELQVSNNDLLGPDLELNVRNIDFRRFHPHVSLAEQAKVRAMGEAAYQREKLQQAITWISTHPRRFLTLTAERMRLIWLPRMARLPQTVLEWALTILGLAGLVVLFRQGNPCAWVFASALFAYPVIFYVIEVTERYHFPMEIPLFLLAAHACVEGLPWAGEKRFRQGTAANKWGASQR